MSIPCRLTGRMFGLMVYSPWEYIKSPPVPGLSFPSSYTDSTFLSIFAVPNNSVFWITSSLTFTPIRFMYSLKLTDHYPKRDLGRYFMPNVTLLWSAILLRIKL